MKSFSILFVITLFLSLEFALAQVSPGKPGPLKEPTEYEDLGLKLSPPKFWRERFIPGASSISFSGPSEDGVFPRVIIIVEDEELEGLYESRMKLRSRVRMRLLSSKASKVELMDERESYISDRAVLEQTFSYELGHRRLLAAAYHFSPSDTTFTFIYSHSEAVFYDRMPLIRKIFASIVLAGEEDDTLSSIIFWGTTLLLLLAGALHLFRKSRAKALHEDRIQDVKTLERIDLAKGGSGELVIGEEEEAELDAPTDFETGIKILDLSKRDKDE